MSGLSLRDWLTQVDALGGKWIVKRLTGNDTGLTKGHQAGVYFPKECAFRAFPDLNADGVVNPRAAVQLHTDSHGLPVRSTSIIYYNSLTRDECRITGFGGRSSPFQAPENTGALAIFVFLPPHGELSECRAWLCTDGEEDDEAEAFLGPVEPLEILFRDSGSGLSFYSSPRRRSGSPCKLLAHEIPAEWLVKFPSGSQIIDLALSRHPKPARSRLDELLLSRRACEFEVFRSVEEAFCADEVRAGFSSLAAILDFAQTVLQRRKSRAGRSLELHLKNILVESGFIQKETFDYCPKIEGGKEPDFLFPSAAAYNSLDFPAEQLRLLAIKTTLKDRWRQVLNEGDRVATKHLLTLQEGVTISQFAEMHAAGIRLIVPRPLQAKFPAAVRTELISLEMFMVELKTLYRD